MFGWGLLAGRVEAVPRGLPPGRAHRLLRPIVRGSAGLRGGGGSWGRAPRPTSGPRHRRPIRSGWPGSTRPAPAGTLRHAAQLFLHATHGPLLPGAPICSSSSRPLLVTLVVVVIVVVDSFLLLREIQAISCLRGQSTRDQWRRGNGDDVSLCASSAFRFVRSFDVR